MSQRDIRREEAQAHIIDMRQRYHREIESSIASTRIYSSKKTADVEIPSPRFTSTAVCVEPLDSVSAVFAHIDDGKVALLDFASYRHPGGGYDNGAWAQEEAICAESDLFNVLDAMRPHYYDANQKAINRSLYADKGMYVPDIVFERGESAVFADVIVCAAPNSGAAMKNGVLWDECINAMRSRIESVMRMAAVNEPDCLILGAFGCGVFRNSPEDVANMFKEWMEAHPGQFAKVVFAIMPDGPNLPAFEKVFQ